MKVISAPADQKYDGLFEHRRAIRIGLRLTAFINTPEGSMRMQTRDLSLFGLRVVGEASLHPGQSVGITLCLPDGQRINAQARIVWGQDNHYGLEIENIAPQPRRFLGEFLLTRLPGGAPSWLRNSLAQGLAGFADRGVAVFFHERHHLQDDSLQA